MNRSQAGIILGLLGLLVLEFLFGGLRDTAATIISGQWRTLNGNVLLFWGAGIIVLLVIAEAAPMVAWAVLLLLYVAFIMSHLGIIVPYVNTLSAYFNTTGKAGKPKRVAQGPASGIFTAHK